MDFLKKAKASLKDLEGDLNKATQALGLGEKRQDSATAAAPAAASSQYTAAEPVSNGSTPATSNVNTPSTSVAPSTVAEQPHTKLPLAIRKLVRDDWENKQPELEAQLSSLMGVPWKTSFDTGYLYTMATDDFAKKNPGRMFTSYIEGAISGIKYYFETYGADGKAELNTVASTHTITIEPTTNPKISTAGCEISGGVLRLLFAKSRLGYNTTSICSELSTAVNAAGVCSSPSGGAALDFDAKSGIKKDYEPKIEEVRARIATIMAMPTLTLIPNFEHNFAAISAWRASDEGQNDRMFNREWQKRFGKVTIDYFEGFASKTDYLGFTKDEMLQEGFKDAVEKNEIGIRVVNKLAKGTYNECVIENGVLFIQTTPKYWWTNHRDAADKLLDML